MIATVWHRQELVEGHVDVSAQKVGEDVFRVCIQIRNLTALEIAAANRDEALTHSLVSTHTVLGVRGGEFVSLLEPPAELQEPG